MARILIIDDNETMREGMAATVRRMGHEALVAGGGAEGDEGVACDKGRRGYPFGTHLDDARVQVGIGLADELLARDAGEVAQGLVHEQEPQVAILHEDRVGDRIDDVVQEQRVTHGSALANDGRQPFDPGHSADLRFRSGLAWPPAAASGRTVCGRAG